MEIVINNQSNEKNWNRYKQDFNKIASRTQDVLQIKKIQCASVIFVNAEEIRKINYEYRHIDKATDVISFALLDSEDTYEILEEGEELGDIFINIEAIRTQANDYDHSLRREVCFLFTHGLLHLLGYDHLKEDDEETMFKLQDVILNEIVPKKNR